MDKRTFFFVLSLTLTLFVVNTFFDNQRQEELKEWHQQQTAKKKEQLVVLQQEVKTKTASSATLPIASIPGVETESAILAIHTSHTPESTIQYKGFNYTLSYSDQQKGGLLVYQKNSAQPLKIGDLLLFGHYDLQLVTFPAQGPKVTLVSYSDGQFKIPEQEIATLSKELELPYEEPLLSNGIVLQKTSQGYIPVALYNHDKGAFTFLEQISELRTSVLQEEGVATSTAMEEERYYVLENAYQQLVFSNKGAALVEINLPFESESNTHSVVKEIGFDRSIKEHHPVNAHFPMRPYDSADGIHHSKGKFGGYYPLLRRDLAKARNIKPTRILPEYYACNIVSEYPGMAELTYSVKEFTDKKIVFEATQRNRKIQKTYAFDTTKEAPYCVNLMVEVEGDSRGLWITSGIPEVEWISNAPASVMKYRMTRQGKSEVSTISPSQDPLTISNVYPDWLCNSNGFLGMIMDPLTEVGSGYRAQEISGTVVPSRLVLVDEEHERFSAEKLPGNMMLLPLNPKGGTMEFRLFAGPFATDILKHVDTLYTNAETGYNPDYLSSQSFHGWFSFISAPFSKFLFVLMRFFHYLTDSWALSIVLLTVALRLMLYPLNNWSTKSMVKMQEIGPEVQRIQEKYKKDQKRAQLEIMNLYREKGVNPASGCLPLLIQMPFLIGMFDLLKSTFELRGASFIPGWIDNLAAPDVLFTWGTSLFFIGTEFHLLPLLLGGVMFLQQRLMSTAPTDPNQMTEQQRQQRAMGTVMTVVFSVMFYNFPSGLNIYWLSSMLLGMLQQWWTQKKMQIAVPKEIVLQPEVVKSKKKGRKKN